MTFKHKLSSRLALLKDRVVLASVAGLVTAAIVACELPVRATDPGSTIADLLVSPKILTLRQNATADFTAVGFMSTGDSASMAVSWSVTAGSIIDTSSNGKRHYGHYKAGPNPGQYKVVATGSPGGVSDTAVVTVTVAPVSAVSVAPTAATILMGATTQLQATTTDSLGNVLAGRTVTWASNNSTVTVGGNDLATGAGTGSATITETSEGKSGTATITVAPTSAKLQTGHTVQLSATARDPIGNVLSGRVLTWSSNSSSVVSVNGSGLVTGAVAGSVTITASSEGQSGTSGVTVTFVPVASVTVNPASASVQVGQTVQLSATPRDANGNALPGRTVTWASTNTTVATVNGQGLVTAKVVGSATITATSEGQSGSAAITVTAAPVATVTVPPAAAAVQPGQTVQLTATTRDANGNILTGRTVTWASNNNPAATVSSSGLVTGVATGTALITATSEGKTGSAMIAAGTPPPPATCGPTGTGQCYYVDGASGNDGNPGDSTRPCRTVQQAAGVVNPGDVVIVRNGVYTGDGNAVLSIGRGGSAGNLVVFKSQNKWGAVLDGQNNYSAKVIEIGTNYVRVEGFEVKGSNHYGVDPSTSTHDIEIVGNNIHDVGRYCESSGIGLSAIDAYSDNLLIDGNWVHDIGRFGAGENGCQPGNDYWMNHDHGVYNGQGTNVIIRNNVFYNITRGWRLQHYGSSVDQLYIVNNTFAFPNPNRDGQIILAATPTNLYIQNNIFYQPGQNVGISGTTSGAHIDHNLSTGTVGGGGIGSNIENTDPQFVNPSALDFRLQAGSPAIDAGVTLSYVSSDLLGVSRPQGAADGIGAFEFH